MALQVWLPLTKDLRNQGLNGVAVSNSGATYSATGGKLGGCYIFTTSSYQKISFPYSLAGFSEFTVCLWIKPTNTTITGCLFTFTNPSDYWQFVITNGNKVGIRDSSTGETGSRKEYTLGNFTAGAWTHLAVSYNTGTVRIYKNGVLFSTNSTGGSTMNNYSGTNAAIGEAISSSSSYYTEGSINDFRLYDTCLSAAEVKRISQGLVLHYPLNHNGWGNENLMPNSVEMQVGSANPSTGTWRIAGSSQMNRSRVSISDAPLGSLTYGCQSVGLQTGPDASCWGIDGFPRENGTTYTISAWGRIVNGSTTAAMLGFSIYSGTTLDYGGTYGKAKSSDTEYYGSGAYDYSGGKLNPNGNWTRIYRTFTSTSTSDNIYIGFNTAKTGSNVTLQVCGVQLEKGNKMTPWSPALTDTLATTMGLNGTTEYDISGFCNNGTRTGTFTWTSDTPKYAVSTYFADYTQYISCSLSGYTPDAITMSCWVKTSNTSPRGGYHIPFNVHSTDFEMSITGSSGKARLGYVVGGSRKVQDVGSNIEDGQWHMMTSTYDGTAIKRYVDGELVNTESATGALSTLTTVGVGAFPGATTYGNTQVYESDCRIYATALSAADVKSLYQNCATIDPDGTIRGQIRS